MQCDAFFEDLFPGISYLLDFIGTARTGHNFRLKNETNFLAF